MDCTEAFRRMARGYGFLAGWSSHGTFQVEDNRAPANDTVVMKVGTVDLVERKALKLWLSNGVG